MWDKTKLFKGRYASYATSKDKVDAYRAFLKTNKGREWLYGCKLADKEYMRLITNEDK